MTTKAYEKKMIKRARLDYLYDNSEFRDLSLEEFETWKHERGLSVKEVEDLRWRTREVKRVCESFLGAYLEDQISFNGKKGLLETLRIICGSDYQALFAKSVIKALGHSSKKKRGPSTNRSWIRKLLRFYLNFLKNQKPGRPMLNFPEHTLCEGQKVTYPGKSYRDRIALVRARFHKMGLGHLVSSDAAIRELVRGPKKVKRSKRKSLK